MAAQAKRVQVETDTLVAAQAKLDAAGATSKTPIRKARDVPEAERKKMFWVADLEQAEAWFNLHNVRGRTLAKVLTRGRGTTESPTSNP